MQGGAGRRTGLSARRARRTKSRGYSRPRQTMADQSILKSAVLPASLMPLFLSSGPTSVWSWQKKKFDNPVAILWENWVASIGSIWRGFGWDSSQTEVLQSPWISKKWPKHLLIFPSAQYNHIVGGMMKKREAQKIEKTKNQIGFEILWFRRRARKLNKFYPRLTFLYF